MPRTGDQPFLPGRLIELAMRAEKTDGTVYTPFLTPPEAQAACAAARKQGVGVTLFGGYAEAERQMAGFSSEGQSVETFPIAAITACWPRQTAPSHRDLLGSVMALGISRQALGDIVLLPERAYLFVQEAMAEHVADQWSQANRTRLRVALVQEWPELTVAQGTERRDTVASLRLDAVVASGLCLSRTKASELIAAGCVKLRHVPTLRGDAPVEQGDVISVRGIGRLQLTQVGQTTRKRRLPITIKRCGV